MTCSETEDGQNSFNGRDAMTGDEKSGLKEKGESGTNETEIAVADTENEDRIEVPVDDVEHGQRGTDSRTSGSKNMKIKKIFKYLKVRRTTLKIFSQGQINGVLYSPSHSWV